MASELGGTAKALTRVSLGLSPRWGALHAGHRSLIRRARRMSDRVGVSLFVNPLQFAPTEEFIRYPRSINSDIARCRDENVDLLFLPSSTELYPDGFQTSLKVSKLAQRWEGEHRPSHFQGVAIVVTKLLNLIRPHLVFFGQKDYQQFLLVRQLVLDLDMAVKVVMVPTVREPDGLACSSRNQLLTPGERTKAIILFQALRSGKEAIETGMQSPASVRKRMVEQISREPQVSLDYVAVCDAHTLEPVNRLTATVVLLGAIRLGKVRLIDNILVKIR